MINAISGSQGCGKTTILDNLKATHNIQVVERKASRSIQADWGYTLTEINADPELTMKFQDEILTRKINDDITNLHADSVWFTERSVADFFTYALVVLGKEPTCSDFLDAYYERCEKAQHLYDHIFYLTAGHFSVEKDPHRASPNKHYCRLIDQAMLDITKQLTDPERLTIIDTPDIPTRVKIIMDTIQKGGSHV